MNLIILVFFSISWIISISLWVLLDSLFKNFWLEALLGNRPTSALGNSMSDTQEYQGSTMRLRDPHRSLTFAQTVNSGFFLTLSSYTPESAVYFPFQRHERGLIPTIGNKIGNAINCLLLFEEPVKKWKHICISIRLWISQNLYIILVWKTQSTLWLSKHNN